MKFNCKKCNKTKDIYKVKFTAVGSDWVCKEASCCNEFMEQIKTKEYEGLPEIKRNEMIHSKPDGDKLWLDAKKKLASGEPPKNKNN